MTPAIAAPAPRGVTTPAAGPVPSIVAIAKGEFDQFHGIDEGTQPLRGRIADYYEAGGGSRDLDPTLNDNAWSAAFVFFFASSNPGRQRISLSSISATAYSFMRQSRTRMRTVALLLAGHPITEYARQAWRPNPPQSQRRDSQLRLCPDQYRSTHSTVRSWSTSRSATGYAMPSPSVAMRASRAAPVRSERSFSRSDANGLLDQSEIRSKLICVVENLLAAGVAIPAMALGPHVVKVRTDLKLRGGPSAEFSII